MVLVAKPTPCPNGPEVAGTTSATSTRKTAPLSAPPPQKNIGWAQTQIPSCRLQVASWTNPLRNLQPATCHLQLPSRHPPALIYTSAAPNTPSSISCTLVSGTRSFSTSATSPPR